jgi:hypothetical protein
MHDQSFAIQADDRVEERIEKSHLSIVFRLRAPRTLVFRAQTGFSHALPDQPDESMSIPGDGTAFRYGVCSCFLARWIAIRPPSTGMYSLAVNP